MSILQMIALGPFRFSIHTTAYQSAKHSTEYRWQAQNRLGRLPAQQFIGEGKDSLELNGEIYPHFRGSFQQLDAMREHAALGKPLELVDGQGKAWGQWVIKHIEDEKSVLFDNGLPRKVAFRIAMTRYGK